MKFNVNGTVRIKLTQRGRILLYEQWVEMHNNHPSVFPEFIPIREDDDGWSEWQLWYLMSTFGEHISMTSEPPFETTIEIPEGE